MFLIFHMVHFGGTREREGEKNEHDEQQTETRTPAERSQRCPPRSFHPAAIPAPAAPRDQVGGVRGRGRHDLLGAVCLRARTQTPEENSGLKKKTPRLRKSWRL